MIRPANRSDVHEVTTLIYNAIKDIAYQLTGEEQYEPALAQLREFYLTEGNRFSYSLIQVMEHNNKVAGMILCYSGMAAPQLYEPIALHLRHKLDGVKPMIDKEAEEDEYYIDAIAVHPKEQGKGIAKALFQAAEDYARTNHFHSISLNVDQDNDRALALYEKLGYKTVKQLFINKRPYWHMVKRLN